MYDKISAEQMPVLQVSGQVLREVLYEKGYVVTAYSSGLSVYCSQVRLYYPGMRLQPGQAVVTAEMELARMEEPEVLIIYAGSFLGNETEQWHSPCLHVTDGRDQTEIFAVLQDFFHAFYCWDTRLRQLLYTGGTVAQLGEAAYDFLKAPMTIYDENYVILTRTGGRNGIYPVEYNKVVDGFVYMESAVHEWKEDPSMVETMKTTGPQWWQMDAFSKSIYCNIRGRNGRWKGRMIMHPGEKKLGEADRELAGYFVVYLTLLMLTGGGPSNQVDQVFKKALKTSLAEEKTEVSETLLDLLRPMGWSQNDSYQVYCLRQTENDVYQDMHMEQLTCTNIEDKLPHARAFIFRRCIVALVNLTASGQREDDARMKLVYIVRDGLFKMGISMPFAHFERFPMYYAQAFEAMPLQDTQEDCWYRDFRSCRLRYALKVLHNDPVAAGIYSSAMRTLYHYDRENGTELFWTLGVYLEQERSLKQTALHFRINRTTVNYRLNRIREMTGVNLDDPEERLLLLMLYRMHKEGYLP